MPKYGRYSDIDLEEAYGGLLDRKSAMLNNIRTQTWMHSSHHCEDTECGGSAPKASCIHRLHVAWCLAPVVDKDQALPTYNEVVICGARFSVRAVTGCAEHPFIADYNRNVKDARNGRPNLGIRWKKIFQDFKAKHEADKARETEKLEALQKRMGMTGHQRRTIQVRQDDLKYRQQKERRAAERVGDVLKVKRDTAEAGDAQNPRPSLLARPGSSGWLHPQEIGSILSPLWLYTELFKILDIGVERGGEMRDWMALDQDIPVKEEMAVPTFEWLYNELFRAPRLSDYSELDDVDVSGAHNAKDFTGPHLHRKDNKQAKKQRAMASRALARIQAEEIAIKEAAEVDEFEQLKQARQVCAKGEQLR
ncbi:hypothetical protein CC86DRAFT_412188 [Ophiobolus disseminans]|uniref:Uncharacterized protein n=1 Tax=Ophiobolus disseminans TaxID=1469910 RepID=A0A6A6ZHU5_9PLEO|nr:hypothetical protein CC86DRAFT_412188 [Ophiobolus disseminans]